MYNQSIVDVCHFVDWYANMMWVVMGLVIVTVCLLAENNFSATFEATIKMTLSFASS